jgi:hypothetical protein
MQTKSDGYEKVCATCLQDFKGLVAGVSFQIQGGMVILESDWSLMLLDIEFRGTEMGAR